MPQSLSFAPLIPTLSGNLGCASIFEKKVCPFRATYFMGKVDIKLIKESNYLIFLTVPSDNDEK